MAAKNRIKVAKASGTDQTHPCSDTYQPDPGTLERLIHPRFFKGQWLTDDLFNLLVTWVQTRAALVRFRDGWGAVCGLDVQIDPLQRSRLHVTPGYAVDCWGRDLVVGETLAADLQDYLEEPDPCQRMAHDDSQTPSSVILDVYLTYREVLSQSQVARGQSASQNAPCQYSRAEDTATLRICVVDDTQADPYTAAARRWQKQVVSTMSRLEQLLSKPEAVIDWLKQHPSTLFGFLDNQAEDIDNQVRVKWLVFEAMSQAMHCACTDCADDPCGVRLARLRLSLGKTGVHICAVIDQPPYRRPLQPACYPAPLGMINLGQVFWNQEKEAIARLSALGLHVQIESVAMDRLNYKPFADWDFFAEPGSSVTLQVVDPVIFPTVDDQPPASWYARRVVGFSPTNKELRQPAIPAAEPAAAVARPQTITAAPAIPIPVQADDLTVIKGIGERIVQVLNAERITTFAALARTKRQPIIDILRKSKIRVNPDSVDSWIKQADQFAQKK